MNVRRVRNVAALVLIAACVIGYVQSFQSPLVGPVTPNSSNVQSVLDLPALQYCSVQKQPVTWYAQKEFLTSQPVRVDGDPNLGIVWLDLSIPNEGEPTIVRYYASERDLYPCQFGLLNVGMDLDPSGKHHYTRNGEPFTPGSDQQCFSYMPPIVTTDDTGAHDAILRCDRLVPYFHG